MIEYNEVIKNKTNIIPNTILEIGSRDANDSELLRGFFDINPKNVWIVEPNPIQHNKIIGKYPEFNLIKYPVFNEEKEILFNAVDVNDQVLNGVSSVLDRVDNLYDKINTNKIKIKTILGSELLSIVNLDVDLCKIDVEGATYEVLESFGDDIVKIKSMHIECEHREVWVNQKLYNDVKQLLITKGYTEVYFNYCNNDTLQSDSIWVLNFLVK
jgi:FkbM family methyltransferase